MSYLSNKGSYQKTVKGVPPLIYHAKSIYAPEKWKGHLPSYLNNLALHVSATCWYMHKVSKLGHALTPEPFELESCAGGQSGGILGCLTHWDGSQVSHMSVHVSATCRYARKVSNLVKL